MQPKYKAGDILWDVLSEALLLIESVDTKTYTISCLDCINARMPTALWDMYRVDLDSFIYLAFDPSANPFSGFPPYNFTVQFTDELLDCGDTLEDLAAKISSSWPQPLKHKCSCETFQVVHFGCKCGGI